ncbi:hypothetical protein ZWY2020_012976 [Hordeum vulgare]|nr:hypothetical protein ZWY2020_012976 [Hordeum vulgare]
MELKEEDIEEEVAFQMMLEHINIYNVEDVIEEDALPPAPDVVVLTNQAKEAQRTVQQQLDQAVLAASLSTVQAEAVRWRATEEEAQIESRGGWLLCV